MAFPYSVTAIPSGACGFKDHKKRIGDRKKRHTEFSQPQFRSDRNHLHL